MKSKPDFERTCKKRNFHARETISLGDSMERYLLIKKNKK